MKIAVQYKTTSELMAMLGENGLRQMISEPHEKSINKMGRKVMGINIMLGQVEDDFVMDLLTCVVDYDTVRVPRFINPLYRKNEKKKQRRAR